MLGRARVDIDDEVWSVEKGLANCRSLLPGPASSFAAFFPFPLNKYILNFTTSSRQYLVYGLGIHVSVHSSPVCI